MRALVLVTAFLTFTIAPQARAAERTRALVLDIKGSDLRDSELETLTGLVTAHLSRYPQLDVLSGADMKRLIDLEAQKQSMGCDEGACLAELAGALGAELIFYGQAGKLGSTIVLTLNLYDANKGTAVARQPVEAKDLGQLPGLVGPAIDAMVHPLLQRRDGAVGDPPPVSPLQRGLRASTANTLSARAQEVYAQQEMDICVAENDRLRWWFCDRGERYTENAFIRSYSAVTGKDDLNAFEQNRNPQSFVVPASLVGLGAAFLVAAVPIGYFTYVDKQTVPSLANGQTGDTLTASFAIIGASTVFYGAYLSLGAFEYQDGEITDHSMSEPRARQAVADYNDALAAQIAREYGGAPENTGGGT